MQTILYWVACCRFFCAMILTFFLMAGCATISTVKVESGSEVSSPQSRVVTDYPKSNFGLLTPLIGEWRVQDWQLQQDGEWKTQSGARWRFYPIHGDTSLQDAWISNVAGENHQLGYGTHLRVFDSLSRTWQSVWLSSRTRSLEFYRGIESDDEVSFVSTTNTRGRLTRTVFSNISQEFFNWRMEWSNDGGETWLVIYKVDATRIQ